MNNVIKRKIIFSLFLSDTNRKRTAVELTPASSSVTAPTLLIIYCSDSLPPPVVNMENMFLLWQCH